jgi:hypothetical protein
MERYGAAWSGIRSSTGGAGPAVPHGCLKFDGTLCAKRRGFRSGSQVGGDKRQMLHFFHRPKSDLALVRKGLLARGHRTALTPLCISPILTLPPQTFNFSIPHAISAPCQLFGMYRRQTLVPDAIGRHIRPRQ